MSSGGQSAVYMCLSIVSAVMFSALGYMVMLLEPSLETRPGESGYSVVVDDMESSLSSDSARLCGGSCPEDELSLSLFSLLSPCLDIIFCVMRVCEKGVLFGADDFEYSSTVERMAVVISSRDVYGKQMFKMHLEELGQLTCYLVGKGHSNEKCVLLVVLGCGNGTVDNLEHIVAQKITLAQHADAGTVSFK